MSAVSDSNVVDAYRPHEHLLMTCSDCEHRWVAVFPVGTEDLECPKCHNNQEVRVMHDE